VACAVLKPADNETRAQIAAVLGLAFSPESLSPSPSTELSAEPITKPDPSIAAPPKASETPREPRVELVVQKRILKNQPEQQSPLGPDALDLSRPLQPLPPKLSLLDPRWVRGIFSKYLSMTAESRELDVLACIRQEVLGLPYRRVPLRPMHTMSAGVRCFIDASAPLDILSEDARQVVRSLRAAAGFERVEVRFFHTVPDAPSKRNRGVDVDQTASRSPVLLLTDFGYYSVPGRAWTTVSDWLEYIERESARGAARIVALTPLHPMDWPRAIRTRIEILPWDHPFLD
jgi:hypothetical protein